MKPLVITPVKRDGTYFDAWDLYVGAVVPVLGRPTTLSAAAKGTRDWLDEEAVFLFRKLARISELLRKFDPKVAVAGDLPVHVARKLTPTLGPGGATAVRLNGTIPLAVVGEATIRRYLRLRSFRAVDESILTE